MSVFHFLALLVFSTLLSVSSAAYCSYQTTSGYTSYRYCSYSCCGTYYSRYCCSSYYYSTLYYAADAGMIVGCVVGGLFGLAVFVFVIIALLKHFNKRNGMQGTIVHPVQQQPPVTISHAYNYNPDSFQDNTPTKPSGSTFNNTFVPNYQMYPPSQPPPYPPPSDQMNAYPPPPGYSAHTSSI